MGKRKSSKPPPKKKAEKLDTQFTCPFCNTSKAVAVTLDHEKEKGIVRCTSCKANWESNITHLTEAIDVYSDWIDACEEANA